MRADDGEAVRTKGRKVGTQTGHREHRGGGGHGGSEDGGRTTEGNEENEVGGRTTEGGGRKVYRKERKERRDRFFEFYAFSAANTGCRIWTQRTEEKTGVDGRRRSGTTDAH